MSAQPNERIQYDMENYPLQIKTNSANWKSTKPIIAIWFENTHEDKAGGLFLYPDPLRYQFTECSLMTRLTSDLPTETDKIWRITFVRKDIGLEIQLHCNDRTIFNTLISDSECDERSDWSTYWSRLVANIQFKFIDAEFIPHPITGDCSSSTVQ